MTQTFGSLQVGERFRFSAPLDGSPQVCTKGTNRRFTHPHARVPQYVGSYEVSVEKIGSTEEVNQGYDIIDRQTGAVVGHAKTLVAACRSVDRRDAAYGAVRFRHERCK